MIFFVLLVGACVIIGIPIAFAFGVGTLSYLAVTTSVPLSTVSERMNEGISNIVLLAVPLFVFLGLLMETAGIARRLVEALASLVGHLRGGLSIVLVAAMYLVSGVSGSKIADMAAVAPVLFPDMERRGQKRSSMIALLATSGAMAETIPPSLVLIIIGSVTGVSIAALFTAGLLPGARVVAVLDRGRALERQAREPRARRARDAGRGRPRIRDRDSGAAAAAAHPLLRRLRHRDGDRSQRRRHLLHRAGRRIRLPRVRLEPHVPDAARHGRAQRRDPADHRDGDRDGLGADAIRVRPAARRRCSPARPAARSASCCVSIVLFMVLGSVLEGIPAMVLFGPLLFPVAKAAGINEVHYAIVAVLAMGIGLFAPPLGVGFFSASAIGKAEPRERRPADAALPRRAAARAAAHRLRPVDLARVLAQGGGSVGGLVRPEGIEPPSFRLEGGCLIQLDHRRGEKVVGMNRN